jgi:hypothetical protein
MPVESMKGPSRHQELRIFGRLLNVGSINVDSHDATLHLEVLRLVHMHVRWRALRFHIAFEEILHMFIARHVDRGAVSLAETETSTGWRLEEFSGEESAETTEH